VFTSITCKSFSRVEIYVIVFIVYTKRADRKTRPIDSDISNIYSAVTSARYFYPLAVIIIIMIFITKKKIKKFTKPIIIHTLCLAMHLRTVCFRYILFIDIILNCTYSNNTIIDKCVHVYRLLYYTRCSDQSFNVESVEHLFFQPIRVLMNIFFKFNFK